MGVPYAEVIGDPIAHSRSPLIHNHWLTLLGIRGEYRATRVRAENLSDFLRIRRSDPDWRGCNVTIPHKEAVVDKLDSLAKAAREVGAVNCIVPRAGKLLGDNTDIAGIGSALDGTALAGRKAVIVGGGGAARAAVHYLLNREIREIVILVRAPERAESLKALAPPGTVMIGSFSDAPTLMCNAAIIINASPLGMRNGPEVPSILLEIVEQQEAPLFDMVYDPLMTPFLAAGRSRRINGLTMLIGQAAGAFELFFGMKAPAHDEKLESVLLAGTKDA